MRHRFDGSLFLIVAKKLLDGARGSVSEEADLRSAISRSYYGLFHIGKQKASDKWNESVSQSKDAHLELQKVFKKKGEKVIARDLGRMRKARNHADYDAYVPNLEGLAQDMFNLANQVAADIDKL